MLQYERSSVVSQETRVIIEMEIETLDKNMGTSQPRRRRVLAPSFPPKRLFPLLCAFVLASIAFVYRASRPISGSPSFSATYLGEEGPTFVLAIEEGLAGREALRLWSTYLDKFNSVSAIPLPPVWVLCPSVNIEASVRETPHLQPLVVDAEETSWYELLKIFSTKGGQRSPSIVALFGEGSVPTSQVNLKGLVESLEPVFSQLATPTAVVSRSRNLTNNREDDFSTTIGTKNTTWGEWLSDKLVSQVWCNRALFAEPRLASLGLKQVTVQDKKLVEILPQLLWNVSNDNNNSFSATLVDGTSVIRPTFVGASSSCKLVSESTKVKISNILKHEALARRSIPEAPLNYHINASTFGSPGESELRIGASKLALSTSSQVFNHTTGSVRNIKSETGNINIVKAQWPPEYVLETTATKDGLVILSNVNAGYLDMAANFLLSVRRTTDAKVRKCRRK